MTIVSNSYFYIPVNVFPGMFSSEYSVELKLADGNKVSFFADRRLIEEDNQNFKLKVFLINKDTDKRVYKVLLPVEPFENSFSRWVTVPYWQMILSNTEIYKCLSEGAFSISPMYGNDTTKAPFNTSAIDLRLGKEIRVAKTPIQPVQLDLSISGISNFLHDHTEIKIISKDQPFSLEPNRFILGQTLETVDFPITGKDVCYSARVEGKSSLARCGVLIHFTAPTIHAGFSGIITLEIINLGVHKFLLSPEMFICQLIIEEVKGNPLDAPNQFSGQTNPTGTH